MFQNKGIKQKSTIAWALQMGSIWAKPLMKSVKRNKCVLTKSGHLHVENVGSGKSQHPLNKRVLPLLETVTPRA